MNDTLSIHWLVRLDVPSAVEGSLEYLHDPRYLREFFHQRELLTANKVSIIYTFSIEILGTFSNIEMRHHRRGRCPVEIHRKTINF